MNFLGHLYFSEDNKELMLANLFGDHFHGRKFDHLPEIIQRGILRHRQIDDYIDHHEQVKELRHLLYKELPKVAGIAIDLYFDHLLAEHWSQFHSTELAEFLDDFYTYKSVNWDFYPIDFRQFIIQLKTKKWMNHYGTSYGLEKSCEGVGNRLSFENTLKNAPKTYFAHQPLIEMTFFNFMKDAKSHF